MNPSFVLFLATFSLLQNAAEAVLPNGQCSATNMSCELESNNVIGIINGVTNAEECSQECLDNSGYCEVFTYFGPTGVPFRDACILLSNCLVLDPCEDCLTEDIGPDCTNTCTAPVEGILGDNLIDFAVDITKEACASECKALLGCHAYTYHFANSTSYPETCFLLTKLQKPISNCNDRSCLSGSPDCDLDLSPCGFRVDGVFYPKSIVVNDRTKTTDIDVISNGSCGTLLAVAIGGGGSTLDDAGSGSGYVEYTELSITSNRTLRAEIGGARVATELTDLSDGSTLLTANPGEDGDYGDGGSGFSGGGGDNPIYCNPPECIGGRGGQDGADGEDTDDYHGGIGSGVDISSIPLQNVVISPGSGGQGGDNCGGGGGGVLVNGSGPSGGGPEHGEGFGAGGGGEVLVSDPLTLRGYPGVIILEFI